MWHMSRLLQSEGSYVLRSADHDDLRSADHDHYYQLTRPVDTCITCCDYCERARDDNARYSIEKIYDDYRVETLATYIDVHAAAEYLVQLQEKLNSKKVDAS